MMVPLARAMPAMAIIVTYRSATVVVTILLATIVSRPLVLLIAALLIGTGLVLSAGRACDQQRQRDGAGEQMFHGISPWTRNCVPTHRTLPNMSPR
jgi:heme O synthase-like polyprenyltransferase